MKKILMGMVTLGIAGSASAMVKIQFPQGTTGEYTLESRIISDMVKPRIQRPRPVVEDIVPQNGEYVFNQTEVGAARYVLEISDKDAIVFYTMPYEDLTVDIKSIAPLDYSVSGSVLMEGISSLLPESQRIQREYVTLGLNPDPDKEAMSKLVKEYMALHKQYIVDHPESPAAVYALMELDGDDFISGFETLTPEARLSPLYVLAEQKQSQIEKRRESERKMEELNKGTLDAYNFSLSNPEGEKVTLSDFRGKWVILDFWGSWCPWCIKGFPALREAYAQYAGKLEIIGIDCNETEQAWKDALLKYDLPWVQVYNSEIGAQRLYDEYAVNGFPTKIVINPEGKVVNITVGEDPSFFEMLAKLIK
ncbi:MAG: TlpA family protein disulfide reductase [Bacteroidales bacterium]|nr:TlpA family protein disulfide reductase [Bacteroidales bacterium]